MLLCNLAIMNSRFVCFIVLLVFVAGCDLFERDDEEPGPESVSTQAASFGMRTVYGLNPEAATNTRPVIFAGFFIDREEEPLGHWEDRVSVKLNGVEVDEDYTFDYQPGTLHELEATLDGETVQGSIRAPAISGIRITSVPDTLCDNEPLRVAWEFLGGVPNDGLVTLDYDFREPEAARLAPPTTSYTIPAGTFSHGGWGDHKIQVFSQRTLHFPRLAGDRQSFDFLSNTFDHAGSSFSTFVASEEVYFYVRRSDLNPEQCP